ncbi:MAG: methionyl-tRNA formyltransferase [Chloroflexia bacterium]
MGTPQFAVPSLRALAAGPYALTVVTQPDRPAGRGGKVVAPPVKTLAEELGLPVMQPDSLRDPAFRKALAELKPEVTVLVAYGEYLAPSLLDLPAQGSINLHPSLLPRWRGSTPIQSAILAGDRVTGVSIIRMDKGLDTGPVLAQRRVSLGLEETAPELSARLAEVGAGLLAETLPLWLRGAIEPRPQGKEGVTVTREMRKEDGLIDWSTPAAAIARAVRALQPWPGTYTYWQGRLFKVLRAREADALEGEPGEPGTVLVARGAGRAKRVLVWTGSGALELLEVQLEGKPPTEARALLSGYPHIAGDVLGKTVSKSGSGAKA